MRAAAATLRSLAALSPTNPSFLSFIATHSFSTNPPDLVYTIPVSPSMDRAAIRDRVDALAAHDLMTIGRLKAQQPLLVRAMRFVKEKFLPENLPGFDFDAHFASFHDSFKLPISYQDFANHVPELVTQVLDAAQKGDKAALTPLTTKNALSSLLTQYSPTEGHLSLSTQLITPHRLIMHDISLITNPLFQRLYNEGRPRLDMTGAKGGDGVTRQESYLYCKLPDGRAMGPRDSLSLLRASSASSPCFLVATAEIEVDVRDTVIEKATNKVIADQTAKHYLMWTFARGPILYKEDEKKANDDENKEVVNEGEIMKQKKMGGPLPAMEWKNKGVRGLGGKYLEGPGEAWFVKEEGRAKEAWRVADVRPFAPTLVKVLKEHAPNAMPRIVINAKHLDK